MSLMTKSLRIQGFLLVSHLRRLRVALRKGAPGIRLANDPAALNRPASESGAEHVRVMVSASVIIDPWCPPELSPGQDQCGTPIDELCS
jgi:hypothetical protein